MKKVISILLVVIISAAVAMTIAEGKFVIHNGVMFGMTQKEVTEAEAAAGVTITNTAEYWSEWTGTFLDQSDAKLYCSYDKDDGVYTLNVLGCTFSNNDSYNEVNNKLIQLYGAPQLTELDKGNTYGWNISGQFYPTHSVTTNGTFQGFGFTKLNSNARYSQWLVMQEDKSSVLITHNAYEAEVKNVTSPYAKPGIQTEHFLKYEILSQYVTENVLKDTVIVPGKYKYMEEAANENNADQPLAPDTETQNIEKDAEQIFRQLAYVHENAVTYLEELKRAWDILIQKYTYSMYTSGNVDSMWYTTNYLLPDMDHYMAFYLYFSNYYGVEWDSNKLIFDQVHNYVFMPMLNYYKGDMRQTVTMIAHMIYGNEHFSEYMDTIKADIRTLMADAPDYKYLSKLQDFYQKTYELVDYVVNLNVDYDSLTDAVNRYQTQQRQIKSEFSFIFDWKTSTNPEWSFTRSTSPVFQDLFDAAQEKK